MREESEATKLLGGTVAATALLSLLAIAAEGAEGPAPGTLRLDFPPGTTVNDTRASEANDAADIASESLLANGDARKRYFLIGPKRGSGRPAEGYRLLIVLPGGDGGAGFHPFVKRVFKESLPDSYLVAQLVAVHWNPEQARKLVWPTRIDRAPGMKFSTEEFIDAVVKDVGRRHKMDPRYVFALGWSSGGPPCYAASLQKTKAITGSFIAMSVFKPRELPPLRNALGHAYYLLHSPDDWIPIRMARQAQESLKRNGAKATLTTYPGGHGWRSDPCGNIRKGITWLERAVQSVKAGGKPSGG